MTTFRIADLGNREFRASPLPPPTLRGPQLISIIGLLKGKRVFLVFDEKVDGPKVANRLIRETLTQHGASFVSAVAQAEVAAWIGGIDRMHLAYVAADARNFDTHYCYQCIPQDITAAVMTTVALIAGTDELAALDSTDSGVTAHLRDKLAANGPKSTAPLLASIARLNALLLTGNDPDRNLAALERRVRMLGTLRDPNAARALIDALADAAAASEVFALDAKQLSSPSDARASSLRGQIADRLAQAATAALIETGKPALPAIKHAIGIAPPPVIEPLKRAAREIRGPWWRFWSG